LEDSCFLILTVVDRIDNRGEGSAFDSEGVGGEYLIPEDFVEAGRSFGLWAGSDDELAESGQSFLLV
jgi:hypothetical protein